MPKFSPVQWVSNDGGESTSLFLSLTRKFSNKIFNFWLPSPNSTSSDCFYWELRSTFHRWDAEEKGRWVLADGSEISYRHRVDWPARRLKQNEDCTEKNWSKIKEEGQLVWLSLWDKNWVHLWNENFPPFIPSYLKARIPFIYNLTNLMPPP